MTRSHRLTSGLNGLITRRRLISVSTMALSAAAAAPLLAACGGEDQAPSQGDTPGTGTSGGSEGQPTGTAASDGNSGASQGNRGGTLTFALSSDPPDLDPHIDTGTAARTVKIQVYNTLVRYSVEAEIEPDLAEEWQASDDGLEYVFKLRAGVTFHDETPLTAEDVKASIERIQNEGTGADRQLEMSAITAISLDDEHTIRLTLDQPNAALIDYLAQPETAILSKEFLEGGNDPNTTMMGTGPFKFVSREPGVRLEFERNDNYFREGLPYLDTLVFIPYQDENTRIAAVMSGDVDLAEYVPWKDMDAIEGNDALKLALGQQSAFMFILYNVREAPFDDPKVRHALGYAFDRQAIVDAVFFGRGELITGGLIPESYWAYNSDLEGTFSYDPDKAKQLLAEAGYGDGFSVKMLSTSQYGMHQTTAEICQKNLQDIGLTCELELYDWATVVQKHTASDYQFRVHGTAPDITDPDFLTQFLHSNSSYGKSDGFSDQQIDQWLEEGRTTLDREKRKEIYAQIEQRMLELSPLSLLCWRNQGYALKKEVEGFVHLPGGIGFLSGITLQQTYFAE